MSASFNKVILLGNITRNPEVRYTPKGSAVCDVGLALNRHYTLDSGEKREEVTFVDATFWGRQAEIAGQYCRKGAPLMVEGRLQLDTWEDSESGQKRSKLRVIGEGLQLLGGKRDGNDSHDASYDDAPAPPPPSRPIPPRAGKPAAPAPAQADPPAEEDDIPF